MDKNTDTWQKFYAKALNRPHSPRTELAISLNESHLNVAVDCGCGTGSDIDYLEKQAYQVHGFDINPDSISICRNRFENNPSIDISQSSFETYDYPKSGVVIANASLFFAESSSFASAWQKIESSLEIGGVFAGDFMGINDSWASNYRSPTTPLTEAQVAKLFTNFEINKFNERDEKGKTSLGKVKHWHLFSVVAVKHT